MGGVWLLQGEGGCIAKRVVYHTHACVYVGIRVCAYKKQEERGTGLALRRWRMVELIPFELNLPSHTDFVLFCVLFWNCVAV